MKSFIITLILITNLSCISQKNSLKGTYYSEKESRIDLFTNGEYELRRMKGIHHINTFTGFSKGHYKLIANNILELNSDYQINDFDSFNLNMKVKEQIKNNLQGKVVFEVINLEETLIKQNAYFTFYFEYLDENEEIKRTELKLENNVLRFNNPTDEFLPLSFSIILIGKREVSYDVNNKFIIEYTSKDDAANYFQIHLPKLNSLDYNYLIFKNEYLLFKENKIYWNGQLFTKEKDR